MTIKDSKSFYSRFLKGHEGKLHFAAHSHHFWPDVSRDAHLQYWDDTALSSDHKWNKIYGEVIPKFQKHVANILNLKETNQIVFAPNTHEFGSRILSLFLGKEKLNVLTTTSEFHSWKRQLDRINELSNVSVVAVSTDDLLTDKNKFLTSLKQQLKNKPDLFFISQVFFDSGLALTIGDFQELFAAKSPETIMVIDGYHGFAAVPFDLSSLEGKVFYMAGGYKYAQAGEGAAFLVVSKGEWRPAYTGWFAEFADLSKPTSGGVGYSKDGMSFMGATQDVSGLYRMNAVWDLFGEHKISVTSIHEMILKHQRLFLSLLPATFTESWNLKKLFHHELKNHGHFLTFEAQDEAQAKSLEEALSQAHIIIDRRGKRLRFGFGMYQNEADVKALAQTLTTLKKVIKFN